MKWNNNKNEIFSNSSKRNELSIYAAGEILFFTCFDHKMIQSQKRRKKNPIILIYIQTIDFVMERNIFFFTIILMRSSWPFSFVFLFASQVYISIFGRWLYDGFSLQAKSRWRRFQSFSAYLNINLLFLRYS